jgi:hypothetical protein
MTHIFLWIALSGLLGIFAANEEFALTLRSNKQPLPNSHGFAVAEEQAHWTPGETAFIVCDMWDKHWCAGASRRVDELAPAMNILLEAGRSQGVLIIHAPSDTMPFYEGTSERECARSAPAAAFEPDDIGLWRSLDPAREPPLPIDDSDGGCDDLPLCPTYRAWTRQHEALKILPEDAVSDSGLEIYRLLEHCGIANVVIMGVPKNKLRCFPKLW